MNKYDGINLRNTKQKILGFHILMSTLLLNYITDKNLYVNLNFGDESENFSTSILKCLT